MTTILVVDDEPDLEPLITQRFRRQIRKGEMVFTFARDGVEALERLEQDPAIGIVLSDINMPRMDGLTLLDELDKLDRTIMAVVVSAYGDMVNIRTAMNRGAFDFITKPIDIHDLQSTIDKARRHLEQLRSALEARDQLVGLQKELSDARALQQSILRRDFPVTPEIEIHADMRPARDVGGDFYDFFPVGDNRLAIVIADVSGKGMPAALFMAISRSVLRVCAATDASPASCLGRMNELLCDGNDTAMFVTLFYGVLDLEAATLTYANAGHLPPYRLGPERAVEPLASTQGIALGVLEGADFEENRIDLSPRDGLFLFTDGVTEAVNTACEEYGRTGLTDLLQAHADADPRTLLETVVEQVFDFADPAVQSDDLTCLMLRFKAAAAGGGAPATGDRPRPAGDCREDGFELSIRNRLQEISTLHERIADFGREHGLAAELVAQIQLSCDELVTNIVLHAFEDDDEHDIAISFAVDDDELVITITDDGKPFSPLQAPDPDLTAPLEDRAVGGLGVYLVKHNMDRVDYERDGERNRVTLTKSLAS